LVGDLVGGHEERRADSLTLYRWIAEGHCGMTRFAHRLHPDRRPNRPDLATSHRRK